MRAAQKNLFDHFEMKDVKKRYGRTTHGGTSSKGRRKNERPLDTRKTLHLVLKSEKAVGKLSFLTAQNQILVKEILRDKARKFGIRVAEYANVGNHLHIMLRFQSRESFQKFLKSVTCLIARKITGARRGAKFGRFWQGLAFTRVLKSYTEELNLKGYITANVFEAQNSRAARERFLKVFNKWVYEDRRKQHENVPDDPSPHSFYG